MHDTPDHELLRRYADHGAEEAFTELVRRHCDLVWAAARRVSGDGDAARDVAQTVFADLARKAGRLPAGTVLAGWLYRAACHAAAKHIRGESRRAQREQQAMQQNDLQPPTAEARAAAELQPVLDAALAELTEADRDAVVLRFLAGRTFAEVGATLGTNEDAAQKRVSRALEKLREAFRQRGVTVSGGTLVVALGVAGTQMAPAGLAATVATSALMGMGATAGTVPWLLVMKSKLIIAIVGGAVVATAFVQQHGVRRLAGENAVLRQQITTQKAEPPIVATGSDEEELVRLRGEHTELLRLRGEVALLRRNSASNVAKDARAAEADIRQVQSSESLALALDEHRARQGYAVITIRELGMAARIFATDHGRFPLTFEEMQSQMREVTDLPTGFSPDQFEFFPHERVISEWDPEMILFREKSARQVPDGDWQRAYYLADGSVHTVTGPTNMFYEFELHRKGTAANAPNGRELPSPLHWMKPASASP